jgi:hypothetical protein
VPSSPTRAELARELLLYKMREYSQDGFCAGWLHGLENELWALALAPTSFQSTGFSPDFFHQLHQLALIGDGWWVWQTASPPENSGPVFVSLCEWTARQQSG